MNIFLPSKWKLYSFLFSLPLFPVAINLALYENRLWKDDRIWLFSVPLVAIIGFFSWYVHTLYDKVVEDKFPALGQSRQRITRKLLLVVLITTLTVLLIFFAYDRLHIFGYQLHYGHLLRGLLVGFSIHLIFETLYEADYMFGKYKESREENKTIQQLSIIHEFDTLKNQVNPHFLFNCFNTLSSLIAVDKKNAEVFLNELSKVYRYLLRINEEGVSTVENEIKFIHSYYKLLQTRHGEAVRINVQVSKGYEAYLLPSLSLQLLVENVVKHNVLSRNKPLVIDIFTTAGNKLVINNNLQRRSVKAPSNRVGLDNIKAKYELLKQPGFQVMEDEKNFTVVLPLIWNKTQ